MSFFLMFRLKLSSEGCCRSLGDSLGQRYGPRYLTECFPYLTVKYRGISKSAFLRELAEDYTLISFWFGNKPFEGASLFTFFYDCCEIEERFARTRMSWSDFSFLEDTIGGCLKICANRN